MAYFDGVKAGDKVWDFVYGWGKVIEVTKHINYPIKVSFDGFNITYNTEGYQENVINQTLFWDKIKFKIPKKPRKKLNEKKYLIDLDEGAVGASDEFINYRIGSESKENGLFRDDRKTAEKTLNAIKKFTKLLALRDQECPDSRGYNFEPGEKNYCIYYNVDTKK